VKIKYKITSDSRITVDGRAVFEEKVVQKWDLSFERRLGTYDTVLMVDISQFPKGNAKEMQPMYELMDIIVRPSARIQLLLDGNGLLKGLLNRNEIESEWEKCKTEIINKFGSDKNTLQMVDNLEYNFENYYAEIRSSLYYFILLSQWNRKKKLKFKTRSTVHEGDSVDIDIRCKEKSPVDDGQIVWEHNGEGDVRHYSKLKKLYEKQLMQYAHAPFDYKYHFSTRYTAGMRIEDIDLFEKSVTQIEEQASEGYKYSNTIEFERIIEN